jgi:hypothetical protein
MGKKCQILVFVVPPCHRLNVSNIAAALALARGRGETDLGSACLCEAVHKRANHKAYVRHAHARKGQRNCRSCEQVVFNGLASLF